MDAWLTNIYAAVIVLSLAIGVFELLHKHESHKKVHKHLKKAHAEHKEASKKK